MENIRIGLIGLGGIMNGNHIPGYAQSTGGTITAVCDIDAAKLKTVGDKLNIPENARFLNAVDLMESGLVDAVDIATPDAVHCPIAMEAVKRNLPICTEKPMGMNYREVKAVCDAANDKNLPGMVCFSWHYNPHIRLMKEVLDSGKLGTIYHVFIRCIKDSGLWDGRRLEWRFDGKQSASGVMGDLCSHMFDIARFLGNEFVSVSADAGIFIKERRELNSEKLVPVTTWDWCNVLARMENGANATFQISRTAQTLSNWMEVELYGANGRLAFHGVSGKPYSVELQLKGEPAQILQPEERHKAIQSQAYINILSGKLDKYDATLDNACKCQAVLDAAYRSATEGRWVTIDEIINEK